MNAPELLLADTLRALLAQAPSLSMAQLQAATGKSQPSISNALAELGDQVHKLGAARSTRYALTKDILGLPAHQAIHITGESGFIETLGSLVLLQQDQVAVKTPAREWLSTPNKLPWFMTPLRPQGFLGRHYRLARPDFPQDPEQWSLPQVLYIAVNHAQDAPGALGLGDIQGRLVPEAPTSVPERLVHYDSQAASVGQTLPSGTSAGGEQPKFLSEYFAQDGSYRHCIIKFSPPHGTPFGERWRSLLLLEQLALQILAQDGVSTATTQVLQSPQRSYLESVRFDRIGLEGKRHVVAVDALHDEFVGGPRENWVKTCEALVRQKLITPQELGQVASIHAFGHYIGNTDMHFGNLSFFVDDIAKPTLRLAPVYDMLPMMWRPSIHTGELGSDPVRPQPLPAGFAQEQAQARQWAVHYWNQAAALPSLSDSLRQACKVNAQRLQTNFAEQ
jgi:HipA-like C-terminal domain